MQSISHPVNLTPPREARKRPITSRPAGCYGGWLRGRRPWSPGLIAAEAPSAPGRRPAATTGGLVLWRGSGEATVRCCRWGGDRAGSEGCS